MTTDRKGDCFFCFVLFRDSCVTCYVPPLECLVYVHADGLRMCRADVLAPTPAHLDGGLGPCGSARVADLCRLPPSRWCSSVKKYRLTI